MGCSRQRRLGWKAEPDRNLYPFVVKGPEQDHSRVNHIEKAKHHRYRAHLALEFIVEIVGKIHMYYKMLRQEP